MMRKATMQMTMAMSVIVAIGVVASVLAQDDAAPAAAAADMFKQVEEKTFTSFFKCRRIEGIVEIRKCDEEEWKGAVEGHYYPLGSSIRTRSELGSAVRAEISFGTDCLLWVTNVAEFGTRPIEVGQKTRTVELRSGRININLPRVLKEGLFFVAAPYFTCSNLAGESWFEYQPMSDGDEAVVRCVTGTMTLTGLHYKIDRMAASHQVRIRSTADDLFSWIRGESGANKVLLDQGLFAEKNFETGEVKDVPRTLEFFLAPKNAVKIFRRRAPVSKNMIVSIMTFDAVGNIKNRCAFAEGRSSVNTGELVVKPIAAADLAAAAKAAAEETEEVEAVESNSPAKTAQPAAKSESPEEEPTPAPAPAAGDDEDI